ncbi:MAG: protease inhibitor I42 family protein [Rhizomicrobium sp.]
MIFQSISWRVVAGAVLAFTVASADAKPHPPTIIVTMAESSHAVSLVLGQRLRVQLPAQAGTGYSWSIVSGANPMLHLNGSAVTHVTDRPGGSAMQVFRFTATAVGSGRLRIEYRRPWEHAVPAAKRFSIRITVRPLAKLR